MGKRIIVEYAERWTSGGIESYILNLVRFLDHSRFDVRIVVAQKESDIYDDELAEYGVHVETILNKIYDNPITRMFDNRRLFSNYFSDNPCDVLHLHICQGVALGYAKMAKKINIPYVISHCHNSEIGEGNRLLKMIGHNCGKLIYEKYPDVLLACSDLAAEWLYSKKSIKRGKVEVTKYIVDVDRFKFNSKNRSELRKEYQIDDNEYVYLNIGRLHYQKNQKFLLDVFRGILEKGKKAKLIIIGMGELYDEIHNYAQKLGIYDDVIFIDKTREVNKYMDMSDVFLLPSLFEGNPVVGTEAQANGLVCLFSKNITREAKVLPSTVHLSINQEEWEKCTKEIVVNGEHIRNEAFSLVKKRGYDIKEQIKAIEKKYENKNHYVK